MLSNGQSQTTYEGDTQNSVEEPAVDEDISEAGETTILRPEDFPDFPEETEVNEPVQMNVQEPVQPTANEPITENIQGKLAEQSNNTQMTTEQQYMEYQKQHTNPADQQFNHMQNQNAGPQGNMQNQYAGQPNNMQNQYAGQPNNMQNQYMGQQRNMQNQ